MRQQASPFEEEARANLRANLAQTGTTGLGIGADIGGAGPANPQMAALLKAQSDADIQRQLQSYTPGQNIARQTAQRGPAFRKSAGDLDQQALEQGKLGGYLGGLQSNAALRSAQLQMMPLLGQGQTRAGVLSGLGDKLSQGGGGITPGQAGAAAVGAAGAFGGGGAGATLAHGSLFGVPAMLPIAGGIAGSVYGRGGPVSFLSGGAPGSILGSISSRDRTGVLRNFATGGLSGAASKIGS